MNGLTEPMSQWICQCCGLPQSVEHEPNTLCPYGIVAAIEAGWITPGEAATRLEGSRV